MQKQKKISNSKIKGLLRAFAKIIIVLRKVGNFAVYCSDTNVVVVVVVLTSL